jgi:hypothetical protein
MKNHVIVSALIFLFFSYPSFSQVDMDKAKRPSPPVHASGRIDSAEVNIYYSSPAVKGRQIWGALVPYGKIWRTGANEATILETSKTLLVGEQTLPAGKYSLFTIPGEKEWTLVLNSVWDQWGAFKYDSSRDVLRLTVKPDASPEFNERLRFEIADNVISLYWENIKVSFPASGYIEPID